MSKTIIVLSMLLMTNAVCEKAMKQLTAAGIDAKCQDSSTIQQFN